MRGLAFGLNTQVLRFLAVGGSNLVLTYAVYLTCLFALAPVPSILIANGVGILLTSVLNIRVVFERRVQRLLVAASIVYYTIYGIVYAALLHLVIQYLTVPAALAPIPVLCVAVPVNFFFMQLMLRPAPPIT